MNDIVQKTADFAIGEDFYGVSIAELQARIGILKEEIIRIELELVKKQSDLSAAENLFGTSN